MRRLVTRPSERYTKREDGAMRQIGTETSLNGIICDAIRMRVLISFDYDGMHRVVAP